MAPRGKKGLPQGTLGLLYNNIFNAKEVVPNNPPRIRASSMPFCPIKFVFKYFEYMQRGHDETDFQKEFYCDIGTAVHSLIQRWIPTVNPGYVMGNWECYHCGEWIKDKKAPRGQYYKPFTVMYKVGPISCPKCNRVMQYQEFELDFPDAKISGHTDGLLLRWDDVPEVQMYKKDGIWQIDKLNTILHSKKTKFKIPTYVLEYKTTSKNGAFTLKDAAMNYKCQATVYTSALRRIIPTVWNIKCLDVKGYIIKYISRDSPHITSKDFEKIVENDKLYLTMCKLVNRLYDGFENKTIKKIRSIKPCKKWPSIYASSHGHGCSFEDICNDSDKEFLDIFKAVRKKFYLEK